MKVAIIGAGGMGEVHSKAYTLMSDVEVSIVVDIDKGRADKIAAVHGAKAYYSVDDMLANEKPDVADICVPTYLHSEISIECMDSGLHTLCEKPIALNREDALKMVEASKRNRVYFMVAQVMRFCPEYIYLKNAYIQKDFGELKYVNFYRMCQAPTWGNSWFLEPDKSGLVPFDLHIHDVDFIHYLLGTPKAVKSVGFENVCLKNSYLGTQYIYSNDLIAISEGGWYSSPLPFDMKYKAIFDKGIIEFKEGRLSVYPADGQMFEPKLEDVVDITSGINLKNTGSMYYKEIRYFIDCIKEKRALEIITPEDSLKVLDILISEIHSAKTGQIVDC